MHAVAVQDQRESWDRFYESNRRPWRGISSRDAYPFVESGRILEVGCGNGKTAAALAAAGYRVVGTDFSQTAIDTCTSNIKGDTSFVCCDACSLPFDDETFDGTVMFHVLEHLSQDEMAAAVSEAMRVTKKGSHILVRVFSSDDLRSGKGESVGDSTFVRGNGIVYHYFTEGEVLGLFSGSDVKSIVTVKESTRFGGDRCRIEADVISR